MKVKKMSEKLFVAKTQREKDEILKKMEAHCAGMSEKEREDAEKELSVIMEKGLQFALPVAVTAGEWTVAVATQATTIAGKLTKDVRRYEYPNIVTVE